METIAQFIAGLAKKAGIPADDANLINILSNSDISKVSIPAELATGIDNSLLSLAQAEDNHPKLKSKYHAQALNAFDARMAALIKDSGLPADKIAELEGEKNTYNRFEQLTAAIRDAASKEAAKGKVPAEDKSALQRQVDDLLGQLQAVKKDANDRIGAITSERERDRVSFKLENLLAGTKTILDTLSPTARQAALNSLINQALTEKEASFAFNETGELILRGKDDTAVVGPNNVKLTPQSLIEETLAKNKILQVSDPNTAETTKTNPNGNGTSGVNNPTTVRGGTAGSNGNNLATALNNRLNREAFEKAIAQ